MVKLIMIISFMLLTAFYAVDAKATLQAHQLAEFAESLTFAIICAAATLLTIIFKKA